MDVMYDGSYAEKMAEAEVFTRKVKQYFASLHIPDNVIQPQEYFENKKEKEPFREFQPMTEKEAKREAGIGFTTRFAISSKGKEEKQRKETYARELLEDDRNNGFRRYEEERFQYENDQRRQNQFIEEQHHRFREGDKKTVEWYFRDIIGQDSYSVDWEQDYKPQVSKVQYDPERKKLSFQYRLPRAEKILTFSKIEYDFSYEEMIPVEVQDAERVRQRTEIAKRIALRVASIIFEADAYQLVDDVSVEGIVVRFDPVYGFECKRVLTLLMNRDQYIDIKTQRSMKIEDLTTNIKIKVSTDLYKKAIDDTKEI